MYIKIKHTSKNPLKSKPKRVYKLTYIALLCYLNAVQASSLLSNLPEGMYTDSNGALVTKENIGTAYIYNPIFMEKDSYIGHINSTTDTHVILNTDIQTSTLHIQASPHASSTFTIDYGFIYKLKHTDNNSILNVLGNENHKAELNINGDLKIQTEDHTHNVSINGGTSRDNSIVNIRGYFTVLDNYYNPFDPASIFIGNLSAPVINVRDRGYLFLNEYTMLSGKTNLYDQGRFDLGSLNLWKDSEFIANSGKVETFFLNIYNDALLEVHKGASVISKSPMVTNHIEGTLDIKTGGYVGITGDLEVRDTGVVIVDSVGRDHRLNDLYMGGYINLKTGGHLALRKDTDINKLSHYVKSDIKGTIAVNGTATIDTDYYSVENSTVIAPYVELKSQKAEYNLYDNELMVLQGFKGDIKPIVTTNNNLAFGLKSYTDYQNDFYSSLKMGGTIENKLIVDNGNINIQNGDWILKSVEFKGAGTFDVLGGNTTIEDFNLKDSSIANIYTGSVTFGDSAIKVQDKFKDTNNINIYGTANVYGKYDDFAYVDPKDPNKFYLYGFIDKKQSKGYLTIDKGNKSYTQEELDQLNANTDLLVTIIGQNQQGLKPIKNQGILNQVFGGHADNYIDADLTTDFIVGLNKPQKLAIEKALLKDKQLIVGSDKGDDSHLTIAKDITGNSKGIVIQNNSKLTLHNFIAKDRDETLYSVDGDIVGGKDTKGTLATMGNYNIKGNVGSTDTNLDLLINQGYLKIDKDATLDNLYMYANLDLKDGSLTIKDKANLVIGKAYIKNLEQVVNGFHIDADLTLPNTDSSTISMASTRSSADASPASNDYLDRTYVYALIDNINTSEHNDTSFTINGSPDKRSKGFLRIKHIKDGPYTNTFNVGQLGSLSLGMVNHDSIIQMTKASNDFVKDYYGTTDKFTNVFAISKYVDGSILNLKNNNIKLNNTNAHDGIYVSRGSLLIADFTDVKEDEALIDAAGKGYSFEDGSGIHVSGIKNDGNRKYILITNGKDLTPISKYNVETNKGIYVMSSNRLLNVYVENDNRDLVLRPFFNVKNEVITNVSPGLGALLENFTQSGNNSFLTTILDRDNHLSDKEVAEVIEVSSKASIVSGTYSDIINIANRQSTLISDRLSYKSNNDLKVQFDDTSYNLWVNYRYALNKIDGYESDNYKYSFDSNIHSLLLGLDRELDFNYYFNSMKYGFYMGYSYIDTKSNHSVSFSKKEAHNESFGFYTAFSTDDFKVRSNLSVNRQHSQVEQESAIGKLDGSFKVDVLSLNLGANYNFKYKDSLITTYLDLYANYLSSDALSFYYDKDAVIYNYKDSKLFSSVKIGSSIDYSLDIKDLSLDLRHNLSFEKALDSGIFSQDMSFANVKGTSRLQARVQDNYRFNFGTSISKTYDTRTYKFSINKIVSPYSNNLDLSFNFMQLF